MTWGLFALLVLATWRTFVLTARDDILNGPRRRWAPLKSKRRDWIECPYYAGFWWAGIWVAGTWLVQWNPVTAESLGLAVGTWWAVAAGVVFVEIATDLVTDLGP